MRCLTCPKPACSHSLSWTLHMSNAGSVPLLLCHQPDNHSLCDLLSIPASLALLPISMPGLCSDTTGNVQHCWLAAKALQVHRSHYRASTKQKAGRRACCLQEPPSAWLSSRDNIHAAAVMLFTTIIQCFNLHKMVDDVSSSDSAVITMAFKSKRYLQQAFGTAKQLLLFHCAGPGGGAEQGQGVVHPPQALPASL